MKVGAWSALILASGVVMSAPPSRAQTEFVQILRFEIDGVRNDQRFKVLFQVGKKVIEPLRFENGFVVPAGLEGLDKVDIRFVSGKYDLLFESVHASAFVTDWIIGVDTKPFDKDNLERSPPAGKKLALVYYIQFVPKNGEDTKMTVRVYK